MGAAQHLAIENSAVAGIDSQADEIATDATGLDGVNAAISTHALEIVITSFFKEAGDLSRRQTLKAAMAVFIFAVRLMRLALIPVVVLHIGRITNGDHKLTIHCAEVQGAGRGGAANNGCDEEGKCDCNCFHDLAFPFRLVCACYPFCCCKLTLAGTI